MIFFGIPLSKIQRSASVQHLLRGRKTAETAPSAADCQEVYVVAARSADFCKVRLFLPAAGRRACLTAYTVVCLFAT